MKKTFLSINNNTPTSQYKHTIIIIMDRFICPAPYSTQTTEYEFRGAGDFRSR